MRAADEVTREGDAKREESRGGDTTPGDSASASNGALFAASFFRAARFAPSLPSTVVPLPPPPPLVARPCRLEASIASESLSIPMTTGRMHSVREWMHR